MQVVPETVGALLDQMVVLRSQRMKPVPARIEKAALREFGQQAQRAELAMLESRIAAFAQGMRAMETCAASICLALCLRHDCQAFLWGFGGFPRAACVH